MGYKIKVVKRKLKSDYQQKREDNRNTRWHKSENCIIAM